MPKETIQYARDNHGLSPTGFASATELTLHWSKGEDAPVQGYVQIGLTRHAFMPPEKPEEGVLCSSAPLHADHRHCSECAKTVEWQDEQRAKAEKEGRPEAMMGYTGRDEPPRGEFEPPSTVFTDELDRDQINKLIKMLRRARDQAFGADE